MKVYKSKISWGILFPIILVLFIGFIPVAFASLSVAFVSITPIAFFIGYMYLKTEYVVTEELLKIRCGFLYNQQVMISSIRLIKETRNPISSPALSLDRIEIKFDKYGSVLISPKENEIFIAHLQRINPIIEFIPRKRFTRSEVPR
jgi:hypothetical protein